MMDTDLLSLDMQYIIDDLPVTVTFNSTQYTGTKSSLRTQDIQLIEGLKDIYRFSVHFQQSDFVVLPVVDDTVTIAGTTYRILAVVNDNSDTSIRLDLGEQYARF